MANRRPSRAKAKDDAKRVNGVRRAGDIVGDIGGVAFKKFGFVQGAIVHRWPEIVGPQYARSSLPESIKFPRGTKSNGTLTLLVEGAQAPLYQHLAPMIIDKINAFFGYPAVRDVVFRQGRLPLEARRPVRPTLREVPKELGDGLREIADPELRACLESLAAGLAGSSGPPKIS